MIFKKFIWLARHRGTAVLYSQLMYKSPSLEEDFQPYQFTSSQALLIQQPVNLQSFFISILFISIYLYCTFLSGGRLKSCVDMAMEVVFIGSYQLVRWFEQLLLVKCSHWFLKYIKNI
jgi:hypothetical protein